MSKSWNQMSDDEKDAFVRAQNLIRSAIERARSELPPTAMHYVPQHPDSIATLKCFDTCMIESEFEVALYAIAAIADAVSASERCWSAIDEAARSMGFDEKQRSRAYLAGRE